MEDPRNFGASDVSRTLVDTVKDYIARKERAEALEKEFKKLKANLELQASRLHELMKAEGVDKIAVDGKTVSPMVQRYVNKHGTVDMEDACRYLEVVELGFMVRPSYPAPTLRSVVIDRINEGLPLWQNFDRYFKITEKHLVSVRAS